MEVFEQVSEEDLQKIAGLLKERRVNKDTILFRQGDAGDALYILLSGRTRGFATDTAGREKVTGFFSEGQYFGEMALLTGEPWHASMQAVADAKLLILRKDDFDDFLGQNLSVMLQMMKVIAQRKATANFGPGHEEGSREQGAGESESPHREEGLVEPTKPSLEQEAREPASPSLELGAGESTSFGQLFTIFSPKGGVGKSTLAVNLAVALAHDHPESVALLDLSLTFSHDALFLNLTPKTSLSATSAEGLRSMDFQEGLAYYLSVHPSSTLRVLVGALRPEEGEVVSGEMAKAAIERLRRHFAYVVIDAESCFSDPVLAALEASDKILMLCSPEISALRDTRECQRIFNDVIHIPRDRVLYLVNCIFPFKTLSKEQVEGTLQQELFAELPYGGELPVKAALKGEALVESQQGSPLAKTVQKLAAQLAVDESRAGDPSQGKRRGFFR